MVKWWLLALALLLAPLAFIGLVPSPDLGMVLAYPVTWVILGISVARLYLSADTPRAQWVVAVAASMFAVPVCFWILGAIGFIGIGVVGVGLWVLRAIRRKKAVKGH